MTALLEEALDAVDGYRDALAAEQQLQTLTAEFSARPVVSVSPFDAIRDDLLAGRPVHLDRLVDDVAHQQAWASARESIPNGLRVLASRLESHRNHVVLTGVDDGLAVLDAHLADLGDHVVVLDETLDDVRNAGDALTAGLGDAWLALTAAVDRYDEIRDAQLELLRTTTGDKGGRSHPANELNHAGLDGNLAAYHPWWIRRAEHRADPRAAFAVGPDGDEVLPPAPWPDPVIRVLDSGVTAWRWPTTDRPAFLRWLFQPTTPARPWVPGLRLMVRHYEQMTKGAVPTDTVEWDQAIGSQRTEYLNRRHRAAFAPT